DQHDVRKAGLDPAKVHKRARAAGGQNGAALQFGMAELMEAIGEADLVEDFQNGRVEGVATELAVEGLVGLTQRDRGSLACQEQSEDQPARPAADHATGHVVYADGLLGRGRVRQSCYGVCHSFTPRKPNTKFSRRGPPAEPNAARNQEGGPRSAATAG